MTSFDVFLFGLLIASDNSLEKGDEWTRKKNECVDEAARAREKEGLTALRATTGDVEFGHTSLEEIFMGPRLRPPSSRRERVEFLDSTTLNS